VVLAFVGQECPTHMGWRDVADPSADIGNALAGFALVV